MLKARILIGRNFCRDLSLRQSADKRDQRGSEGIHGKSLFVLKKTILQKLKTCIQNKRAPTAPNFKLYRVYKNFLFQCVSNIFGQFGNFKPDTMKQFVVTLTFQSIKVALIKDLFLVLTKDIFWSLCWPLASVLSQQSHTEISQKLLVRSFVLP